ncbi:MAG: c-type cytochrome [Acidobacteria bacterium]|nr:c-type cytochrome [Acidobacteriota bacterium]NIM61188.1 c-type cytochrome [Acidobacteriota bacterium]NIO58736.1 c-type cytochrome [Acidobacteriota bacterium]NIQ84510.1 c-type cytochrome [Acidobacteriota bacterium]NIT10468.1 c-type cytochrome [Acidobacteriota bacterium]
MPPRTTKVLVGAAAAVLFVLLSAPVAAGDGQAAFTAQKCNMCHSVPQAEIVAKVKSETMKGPDLPNADRDAAWIQEFVSRKVQLDGKDHKKEFKGTEEELAAIAAWLVELKNTK